MVSLLIHVLKDKTLVETASPERAGVSGREQCVTLGKPTQAAGRAAPLSVKPPVATIRTHFKTPQNGVPFIVPLLPTPRVPETEFRCKPCRIVYPGGIYERPQYPE